MMMFGGMGMKMGKKYYDQDDYEDDYMEEMMYKKMKMMNKKKHYSKMNYLSKPSFDFEDDEYGSMDKEENPLSFGSLLSSGKK